MHRTYDEHEASLDFCTAPDSDPGACCDACFDPCPDAADRRNVDGRIYCAGCTADIAARLEVA